MRPRIGTVVLGLALGVAGCDASERADPPALAGPTAVRLRVTGMMASKGGAI